MAGNHVLLETIVLTQSATSVTFDNIPQTGYTDLKVVVSARSASATDRDQINLNFNTLTTNQSYRLLYGIPGVATGSESGTKIRGGYISGNSATASTFGNSEIYIPNYTSANAKSVSADGVSETNASPAGTQLAASLWNSTAAITTIAFVTDSGSNFLANSTFSLYGLAQVGTTPAIAPKATGGNIVANDGTYWYHAFLSNGTFTPQINLTADVLVVAGGGGGGLYKGGGGGAGGVQLFSSQSLAISNFTCTVGAGGAGQIGGSGALAGGVNSTFGALTSSIGGGIGAGGNAGNIAGAGGSGGGGANGNAAGAGTSGQGNAGGAYVGQAGSGGGGRGAVGSTGGSTTGGAGGAGVNTYSSWLSATGLVVSGFIAGGGGGGGTNGSGGTGGSGGGGNGAASNSANGTVGTINTGSGGGGGGGDGASPFYGYNGGSGIIIIRYLVA